MTPAQVLARLALAAGGGAGGAALGYYGPPKAFGYEDDPAARRSSMILNALMGSLYGGLAPSAIRDIKEMGIDKYLAAHGKALKGGGAASGAMELIPLGISSTHQLRDAAKAQAQAAQTSSIPAAITRALSSGAGRGAVGGAGAAGLAGIVSGLSRRQNDQEFQDRTGRGVMVGKDVLKYLLPMMIGGGLMGSMAQRPETNQTPGTTAVAAG